MSRAVFICLLLNIGTGLFWAAAYVLIIKRGFQEKTYGMPLAALCYNITWEFIFSFIVPSRGSYLAINVTWFLLDLVICYQVLRFWPAEITYRLSRWFYPAFAAGLVTAFGLNLCTVYEFSDYSGMYSTWGGNLAVSILFVEMLLRRGSVRGQSLYIALFKMIGTALFSISLFWWPPFRTSPLFQFLCAATFFYDMAYTFLVYRQCRAEGIDPWTRW